MDPSTALLFAYAFASNVAIAVLPHEPAVVAAGAELGVLRTAVVATLGTLLAGVVDYALFARALARRAARARGRIRGVLAAFERAPFVILVGSSLTPMPAWPFKALAFASGYPAGRYLLALGLGRLARYALLAWLGHALALPTWATLLVALVGLVALALIPKPTEHAQDDLREEHKMDDKTAQRTTESLTHAWEKANLPRIARALPEWVSPDLLTGLGVFAAAVIGAGYLLSHQSPWWLLLVPAGLVVHWFGDSLDGTLARVRKMERERYGYYVDRTADAISTVIIGVCFGLSPYVHLSVAMMMTVGYLLLMLYAEICAYTSQRFPLSFGHLGPTEARIALGVFTIGLMFWTPRHLVLGPFNLTWVDLGVLAVTAGLLFTFLKASVSEARRLDRLDRAQWGADPLTSSGFTAAVDDDDEAR